MGNIVINQGRSGSAGYAMGKLFVYSRNAYRHSRKKVTDPEAEFKRFESARENAIGNLESIYKSTRTRAGSSNAEIFNAQSMILKDEDYLERIRNNIMKDRKNAEWAISDASRYFFEIFSSLEDEAVKAKALDLKDVSNRLIALLTDTDLTPDIDEPVILAADYLSPTELVQINISNLKGIVVNEGSAYSHVVILARSFNIPVVLGVNIRRSYSGRDVVIDGTNGNVIIDPDEWIRTKYLELIEEEKIDRSRLKEYIGRRAVTHDGRSMELFANIARPTDVKAANENDCEAIGLTRTEVMFLNREGLPTEEEHFRAYREITEAMNGRPVVFRTLDLGADKNIPGVKLAREVNPALGTRAIRLCLKEKDIFIPQLKGMLRAAAFGKVAILYPMITSKNELTEIKEVFKEAVYELDRDEIAYGNVKQGVMIETPAAALISDELAKMVDFFSIGTNDLSQYTLALDRLNSSVSDFYDPYHEAVMKLISMTVENAHREGIKVAVCGELASDTSVTLRFIDMGVDALSVAPSNILEIKRFICNA